MFADVYCPETLKPEQLDQYLAQGWFRMGQTIFTTNFLNFKNQLYSAVWLRVALNEFSKDKTHQKLMKRNAGFRIEIQKALITPEKEALYTAYKGNISFETSASLKTLLFGKTNHNVYNTHEITLYDGEKLIAAGFFDLGKASAAGISSFYDPAYKKYSLGKYMIYLKMDYCKKLELQYFYPGYFVPGYSMFDYKLEIGKPALQYLELTSNAWKPISSFSKTLSPLQLMHDKLSALKILLQKFKIASKLLKYEFFDANLIPELNGIELFDFPLFLYCLEFPGENLNPIVYDVRDQQFHWIQCRSVWTSNAVPSKGEIYASHVLKFEQGFFSSDIPETMAAMLLKEITSKTRTLKESPLT